VRERYGFHSPAALIALAMLSLAGSARHYRGELGVTDPRKHQEARNTEAPQPLRVNQKIRVAIP
jgi:hypothetical protein